MLFLKNRLTDLPFNSINWYPCRLIHMDGLGSRLEEVRVGIGVQLRLVRKSMTQAAFRLVRQPSSVVKRSVASLLRIRYRRRFARLVSIYSRLYLCLIPNST